MKIEEITEGFRDAVKHGFNKYNKPEVFKPAVDKVKDAFTSQKDKDKKKLKKENTAGAIASVAMPMGKKKKNKMVRR